MDVLKEYSNWSFERILRHIIYWFAWSTFFILVNYFITEGTSLIKWVCFELTVLPIKLIFTYTVAYVIMPSFLYKGKFLEFSILTLVALIFSGACLFMLYNEIVDPLIMAGIPHYKQEQFIYKALDLLYIAGLFIGFKFFQNYHLSQERNQQLLIEKSQTELKFLKNQIQPHFLFNTLNNIYSLVLSKNDKASETIVTFSDIMSYMLYESNTSQVQLEKEVLHLENYIELEKLRHGRKLELNYHKNIESGNIPIPPLILFPFVENAFKHGANCAKGKSLIEIKIHADKGQLWFSVYNSHDRTINNLIEKSGIGLKNVKKRLELIYSNNYELDIKSDESSFNVLLTINSNNNSI